MNTLPHNWPFMFSNALYPSIWWKSSVAQMCGGMFNRASSVSARLYCSGCVALLLFWSHSNQTTVFTRSMVWILFLIRDFMIVSKSFVISSGVHGATYKCCDPNTYCAQAIPHYYTPSSVLHQIDCIHHDHIMARFTPNTLVTAGKEKKRSILVASGRRMGFECFSVFSLMFCIKVKMCLCQRAWKGVSPFTSSIEIDIKQCPSCCLSCHRNWFLLTVPVAEALTCLFFTASLWKNHRFDFKRTDTVALKSELFFFSSAFWVLL